MNELTDEQIDDVWESVSDPSRDDLDIPAFARAIIQADRAQRQAGQEPVPEGYRLISVVRLLTWKAQANETAARTIKAERYEAGIKLKQWIADVINEAPQTAVQTDKDAQIAALKAVVAAYIAYDESAFSNDEQAGIDWWNALSEPARAYWLERAKTATPAEAWLLFKKEQAKEPC